MDRTTAPHRRLREPRNAPMCAHRESMPLFPVGFVSTAARPSAASQSTTMNDPNAPNLPGDRYPLVALIADTQLGHNTMGDDCRYESAILDYILARLTILRPDAIINCGDMTNRFPAPAQVDAYRAAIARSNAPIRHVIGNHELDHSRRLNSVADALAAYQEASRREDLKRLQAVREVYGSDYHRFRLGELLALVVNTSYLSEPERYAGELAGQEAWLKRTVETETRSNDRVVVFQHWPFFLTSVDEDDDYLNLPRRTRRRHLDLYRDLGITAVFSGHIHRNLEHSYRGMALVSTAAAGAQRPADTLYGVRFITTDADGVRHRFVDLGRLPYDRDALVASMTAQSGRELIPDTEPTPTVAHAEADRG